VVFLTHVKSVPETVLFRFIPRGLLDVYDIADHVEEECEEQHDCECLGGVDGDGCPEGAAHTLE
jgi:hypothetical protein